MLHYRKQRQIRSPRPCGARHGREADIVHVSITHVVRFKVACRVELAAVFRFALEELYI